MRYHYRKHYITQVKINLEGFMGTYGEDRTLEILSQLPKDEFQCFYEPRVEGPVGTNRYPDFLVVWRSRGSWQLRSRIMSILIAIKVIKQQLL